MVMPQQQRTNRPLGNAQSRLSAMPAAPAYGNTTNVNGAQTAIMNPIRRPVIPGAVNRTNPVRATPGYMSAMGIEQEDPITLTGGQAAGGGMPPQLPFSVMSRGTEQFLNQAQTGNAPTIGQAVAPVAATGGGGTMAQSPAYPGGDAPGIASYYRNSAIQGYQGNQQSAMAGDIREATRNAQYMEAEPQATSSTGANQMMARQPADLQNAVTARAANSFNNVVGAMSDPNRLTPDQKAGLARGSALDAAGGGPAADPTGLGGRFGGAMGQQATADAEAIQSGQAVRLADGSVARFTGTPESVREAQNKGKAERESMRDRSNMNVPKEELDRRAAADAAKKERADRHQAFRDENNGMNYRQYDRFQRVRQSISRKVATGRMDPTTAALMLEQETNKAMRRAQGRRSAMSDQARPLAEMPNRPNLATQPPEVAKAAVETMVTKSPVIKELGWTAESKPQDVMNSIAAMNPQQMTSTQKFEAARSIHEYMLSQVESGNPDYAIEDGIASDGSDPRIAFIGLSGIKPGDKDAMVRWFDDLHRQSQALSQARPPAGTSPLAPLTPHENQGGFASPRQGNPF